MISGFASHDQYHHNQNKKKTWECIVCLLNIVNYDDLISPSSSMKYEDCVFNFLKWLKNSISTRMTIRHVCTFVVHGSVTPWRGGTPYRTTPHGAPLVDVIEFDWVLCVPLFLIPLYGSMSAGVWPRYPEWQE